MSLETDQHGTGASRMQLKTIFNLVTEYKPFVVERVELVEHESQPTIEMSMRARENGLPTCSICGVRCSGYDTQRTSRRFDFIPLWMIPVVLVYTMRRVNCPTCGIKVEQVPWAEGKSPLTTDYQWFLSGWARRMSWKEVASRHIYTPLLGELTKNVSVEM